MESKDFIFYYYIVCGILFMVYGFVLIGGFLKMKSNDTGVPYLIVGIVEIFFRYFIDVFVVENKICLLKK